MPLPVMHKIVPNSEKQGSLKGVRVVDLSRLVAGNMLSLQLADFGADVIKVEAPLEGDTLRHWREALSSGESLDAWWQVYGRNKRSVAMNLRDPQAMQLLQKLIASAQVLIESFRPGTLESMGLAPETLHEKNPQLVIVRISGWGQSGPYRDLPGFGSLLEGFSGYAYKHSMGGVPQLPNMALADMVSGLTGAFATMVALRETEVSGGKGQVVDLSLLEPMLAIMGPDATVLGATNCAPKVDVKIASPRGVYRCKDGRWVALSGSTDAMAKRIFEAIGQGSLITDKRFSTNAARLANDEEVERVISNAISEMSLDCCLDMFRKKGVTVGPIYDTAQLMEDEHVMGRNCFIAVGDSNATIMHNVTPRLSETPGGIRRLAPAIGEHTQELLTELGIGAGEMAVLTAKGVIRCS